MSYRNPQQVVDTQTGQHYRNLQASISNTFDKVADASRLEQDRIRKEQEKVQLKLKKEAEQAKKDSIDIMKRDVNASAQIKGIINKSAIAMGTSGSDELNRNVTRMAELMTKGTTDPSETIFLKNMGSLPTDLASATSLVNSLISSSKEDLGANIGEMGGASLTNPSKARNFAMILSNLKEGTSSFSTDSTQADGNQITFTVTPKDGGESVSYTYAQLKELQQGGGSIIQKIPDVTVDYDQSFKAANIVNNKGVLQEDFLGKIGPPVKDPNNSGRVLRFREVDAKKVKASLFPGAKQTIGAMSKSDPNGEVNLYNFYARRHNGSITGKNDKRELLDMLDYGTPLSTGSGSQTELLEEMYVDHQYEREAVNFKKVLASTEEIKVKEELDRALTSQEDASQLVDSFINNPVALVENSGIEVFDFDEETQKITVPNKDGKGKQVLDLTKDAGIRRLISVTQGSQGIPAKTIKELKKLLSQKNLYSKYNKQGIEEAVQVEEDLKEIPIPFRPGYDITGESKEAYEARLMKKYLNKIP